MLLVGCLSSGSNLFVGLFQGSQLCLISTLVLCKSLFGLLAIADKLSLMLLCCFLCSCSGSGSNLLIRLTSSSELGVVLSLCFRCSILVSLPACSQLSVVICLRSSSSICSNLGNLGLLSFILHSSLNGGFCVSQTMAATDAPVFRHLAPILICGAVKLCGGLACSGSLFSSLLCCSLSCLRVCYGNCGVDANQGQRSGHKTAFRD
mmetsp:Transcript_67447/g.119591  ORF Transcript_67447/g.119591 Transcript_67447/m.119591 type:complete len:206 (-) Transcript_67447:429-1046(-)